MRLLVLLLVASCTSPPPTPLPAGSDYPCGTRGVVCVSADLRPTGMCCWLGQTCGIGEWPNASCPAGQCCDLGNLGATQDGGRAMSLQFPEHR